LTAPKAWALRPRTSQNERKSPVARWVVFLAQFRVPARFQIWDQSAAPASKAQTQIAGRLHSRSTPGTACVVPPKIGLTNAGRNPALCERQGEQAGRRLSVGGLHVWTGSSPAFGHQQRSHQGYTAGESFIHAAPAKGSAVRAGFRPPAPRPNPVPSPRRDHTKPAPALAMAIRVATSFDSARQR